MYRIVPSRNALRRHQRDHRRRLSWLLAALILLLTNYSTNAQTTPLINSTLTGTVLDARTRQPLHQAVVHIKGTTHTVETDTKGKFDFVTGQKFPYTLEISFVGYEKQEVEAAGSPIEILLKEAPKQLNEVMVVGYTQTRRNAQTSAITTVSAGDLSKASYTSVTEKLQGQVPGLMIASNSGVPGTSVLVRLRGATSITAGNDPLYIVDGVFINNESLQGLSRGLGGQTPNPLSDINPEDIESVSVLKDANATAVYGARGANGVILITTKRGSKNAKTKLNFSADYGIGKATNLWELVSGTEHAELVNLVHQNDGKSYATRPFRPLSEVVAGFPAYGNPEDQKTYDRVSDVFRTAHSQRYNLSVSGGDAKTNFYLGGEYQEQESTLKLQDLTRYSFRFNLDHTINRKIKIGTSNSISSVPRTVVRVGDGPAGLFQAALHTPTFYAFYNADGSYAKPTVFDNHLAILANSDNHAVSLRSINNLYATYSILPNLSFKTSLSNDYNNYHEKAYYNTNLVYGQPAGEANDVTTTKQSLIAEQLLNFYSNRNNNSFSFFAGNTVQYTKTERQTLTGTGFPSNQFKRITSAAVQTASSSGSDYGLVSFFAGANYAYDKRYVIDANLRADASSRFGADRRWAYFPSVGLAWNISNEKFYPQNSTVGNLRLKTSYGLTGNQDIDDFASRGLWTGGRNYSELPGIAPSQLANPDLRWETTSQFNIGLSGSLFNDRLTLEADYYRKYTSDLLLNEPVAAKTGFSSVYRNVGEISNTGFEFLASSKNITSKDFTWNTTFTVSHNTNKIEKLSTPITGSYGMYRLEQGFPLYSIWVYNYLGVDPQTGNAIYEDVKKDGKITADDRRIVDDVWPLFEGIFKNTFTYKNLDVNLNLFYRSGNKLFNYTALFLDVGGTRGVTRSIQKSALNYWQKPGDVDVLPRPTSVINPDGSRNYESNSSRFLEDASFIRLRDISIGYTLPAKFTSALKISNARFYITGSNLLTLTRYSGPDPETNSAADSESELVQGLDFNGVPQTKSVNLGVNITF
ncbi:TonB-dependent receptor [Segetibacter sp. 3557_3]|uniref:SusC/RagA family TonB-linked outer membrane protein n=1 Tax=Segetibacter sp. 3557_3 TaxID=2547429 RepID=UPI001059159B|nr:TonB-dependent receptor [Segetibacter sp. 3557_3]TDH24541.1 TonB-dependent receptor [Segetibacter sp. 3557_3]